MIKYYLVLHYFCKEKAYEKTFFNTFSYSFFDAPGVL